MKYQYLASLGIAALGASASPLFQRDDSAQCPPGYTMSVYYITVTAEPEPTTTIQATSTVTDTVTIPPEALTLTSTPVETETPDAASTEATPVESQVAAVETSVSVELPVPSATSTSSTQEAVIVPTVPAVKSTTSTVAPQPTTTAAAPTTSKAQKTTTAAASSSSSGTTSSSETSSKTSSETYSGKATYYGGNIAGGTCSFSGYTLPAGLFGTAFSGAQWNDASECGACVQVTGPAGNTIKAMIVDQCPECTATHLDLFENAFSSLAATSEGVISIDWSYVSCGIDSPIQLKNKEGTSQYWFAMQVVNANEPVTALEVSTDGGSSWSPTTRTFYNYFENETGFGTDVVDVRVTGKSGKTVRVNNVSCGSGESVTGEGNF